MKTRIQLYLPPPALARLQAMAADQRTSMSGAARRLVLSALAGGQPSDRALSADRAPLGSRPHRVHVRLSEPVFAALAVTSRDHGQTPAAWTAALLGHCLLDQPMLRGDESIALTDATRHLAAIGVLLNQVARVLNTQVKSTGSADARALPLDLIERCSAQIRSTTQAAHRLMDASRRAYRCADAVAEVERA